MMSVFDVIGIGFGPANIALAAAIRETSSPLRARFLEQKATVGWHTGMLLPGSRMQVSFLKDLATMRDPCSRFSFLAYLASRGRLVEFINAKSFFPTRAEFHDYLNWAAGQLSDLVEYGTFVRAVMPVEERGRITAFDVVAESDGAPCTLRTKNIVLGTGLQPRLPSEVKTSARVWHSGELLHRLEEFTEAPRSIGVIGAGQSAAEVLLHTHGRFPDAEIYSVFGGYGFRQSDNSPLANSVFDPYAVDVFYQSPADVREKIFERHANTNYAAVDPALIDMIHERLYDELVSRQRRLHMLNLSAVESAEEYDGRVELTVRNVSSGRRERIDLDLLICATGYNPADPSSLLLDIDSLLFRDHEGRLLAERDYRIRCLPELEAGIYLQGGTEHTHGISSSLLSNIAARSQEILQAILQHDRK